MPDHPLQPFFDAAEQTAAEDNKGNPGMLSRWTLDIAKANGLGQSPAARTRILQAAQDYFGQKYGSRDNLGGKDIGAGEYLYDKAGAGLLSVAGGAAELAGSDWGRQARHDVSAFEAEADPHQNAITRGAGTLASAAGGLLGVAPATAVAAYAAPVLGVSAAAAGLAGMAGFGGASAAGQAYGTLQEAGVSPYKAAALATGVGGLSMLADRLLPGTGGALARSVAGTVGKSAVRSATGAMLESGTNAAVKSVGNTLMVSLPSDPASVTLKGAATEAAEAFGTGAALGLGMHGVETGAAKLRGTAPTFEGKVSERPDTEPAAFDVAGASMDMARQQAAVSPAADVYSSSLDILAAREKARQEALAVGMRAPEAPNPLGRVRTGGGELTDAQIQANIDLRAKMDAAAAADAKRRAAVNALVASAKREPSPLGSHATPEGVPVVDPRMSPETVAPLAAREIAEGAAFKAGEPAEVAKRVGQDAQNAAARLEGESPAHVEGQADADLRTKIYPAPEAGTPIQREQAIHDASRMENQPEAAKAALEAAGEPHAQETRTEAQAPSREGAPQGEGGERLRLRDDAQNRVEAQPGKVEVIPRREGAGRASKTIPTEVERTGSDTLGLMKNEDGTYSIVHPIEGTKNEVRGVKFSERSEKGTVRPVAMDGDTMRLTGAGGEWRGPREEALARIDEHVLAGDKPLNVKSKATGGETKVTPAARKGAEAAAARVPEVANKLFAAKTDGEIRAIISGTDDATLTALRRANPEGVMSVGLKSGETLHEAITSELESRTGPVAKPKPEVGPGEMRTREAVASGASRESPNMDRVRRMVKLLSGKDATVVPLADGKGLSVEMPAGHGGGVRVEPMEGATAGRATYSAKGGKLRFDITVAGDDIGVLAHEFGHPVLDALMDGKERDLLLKRVTPDVVAATKAKYAREGITIDDTRAREEAALDRLRDYANHGVLERSIWHKIQDFAREVAHALGLGPGGEKRIMDKLIHGDYWQRAAQDLAPESRTGKQALNPRTKEDAKEGLAGIRQLARAYPEERAEKVRAEGAPALADKMRQAERVAYQSAASVRPTEDAYIKQLARDFFTKEKNDQYHQDFDTTAPHAGYTGGVSSPAYRAIWGNAPEKLTKYGEAAKAAIKWATKVTGDMAEKVGLNVSGTVPRLMGRDFYDIVSGRKGPAIQDDFFQDLASGNGKTVDEVRAYFTEGKKTMQESSVRLSPMELRRAFNYMPQDFYRNGAKYQMVNVEPTSFMRRVIADTAHRTAFIGEFKKGWDSTIDMKALDPKWTSYTEEAQQQFRKWAEGLHGISQGDYTKQGWYTPVSKIMGTPGLRYSLDRVGDLMRLNKAAILTGAAIGNIVSTPVVARSVGPLATLKAMAEFVQHPNDSIRTTRDLGLAHDVMLHAATPDSYMGTWLRTAAKYINKANEWANAAQNAVAMIAANKQLAVFADAVPGSRQEAEYRTQLRSLGFSREEMRKFLDGSADGLLKDDYRRRVVESAAGPTGVRGTGSALSQQKWMQDFGPAFMSWADMQVRHNYRIAQQIAEGVASKDFKLAGAAAVQGLTGIAAMGAAGAVTKLFWNFVTGGPEKVQQDYERAPWDQVKDYVANGVFGGSMMAAINAAQQASGDSLFGTLEALSYPASQAHNLKRGVKTALDALSNYDGTEAIMALPETMVPLFKKVREAAAWTIEDQNPSVTRKAVSDFYNWKKDHADLFGRYSVGSGGVDPHPKTTQVIDWVVRSVNRGDELDQGTLLKRIGTFLGEGVDPAQVKQSLLNHRILDKIAVDKRDLAASKIRQDLGQTTFNKLYLHDVLLESLADML